MMPTFRDIGKTALQKYYTPHRFLWRLPRTQPAVALTFDDGPDQMYTPAILDMLAEAEIKATFFLIGEKAKRYPQLVRRIVEEGHGIGGHTFGHLEIVGLTPAELESDLDRCRRTMREASGVDSILFRPPRGRVNRASIHRVCRLGYCLVHWTKTYSDYQQDGVEPLVSRMRTNPPEAGDIILLHDHNAHTRDAVGRLLPEWRSRGLAFTALTNTSEYLINLPLAKIR